MHPQLRHLPLQPVEHGLAGGHSGLLGRFRAAAVIGVLRLTPKASQGRCAGLRA
jgi:hypothetical protein